MLNNSGITLIALVFTVAVLVILSTATIVIALQNEGLIYNAHKATELTQNAITYEKGQLNQIDQMYANMVNEIV